MQALIHVISFALLVIKIVHNLLIKTFYIFMDYFTSYLSRIWSGSYLTIDHVTNT